MRIGQKANVENKIGVGRHTVAIAETDAGNQHRTLFGIAEAVGDEVAQFVNVELRCIDDHVGELADRRHDLALVVEAFADAEMLADWMRPARLAVSPQQSVFGGLDENDRDGMMNAKMFQKRGQFFELIAFASIDEQGGAREAAFTGGVQLCKNRNQFDGKIIDAIKAHVLERVEDGAFARAGQAGQDNELAGFGMMRCGVGSLSLVLVLAGSATRAQFFTRR